MSVTVKNFGSTPVENVDVLLAEDTTGGGHSWRIIGPDAWRRAYVELD